MRRRSHIKMPSVIPRVEELFGSFLDVYFIIYIRAAKGNIDTSHAADPIIVHPDIRKMLLTQKAIAEGGRAMLYSSALMNDQVLFQHGQF